MFNLKLLQKNKTVKYGIPMLVSNFYATIFTETKQFKLIFASSLAVL